MVTRRGFGLGVGTAIAGSIVVRPRTVVAAITAESRFAGEMVRLEKASGGRLGVAIRDVGSGRSYGHRASERFPMCSTFKVLACGAVLARVDAGHEELNRRIVFAATDIVTHSPVTKDRIGGDGMTLAELCEAAMTTSDNTAGNLILSSLGGPSAVTAYARSLGDPVTRLDRIETALNEATPGDPRDTTTPAAMAANLQSLVLGDGLSPRSRDHLTAWLVANKTGGAKLRAGLSKDWRAGDKTGGGGFGTTNDIAVIWPPGRAPLVVCVYLTDTKAPAELRDQTIAAVARAVESTLVA